MKDKIGIWTSILCIIHCLLFPILAISFPIFLKLDIKVEIILISIAFIVGSLSFINNAIKHKYYKSIILFMFGFGFILTSVIFEKEIFNIIGLIILILAHYINYKKIQKTDGCHPHGCKH